MCLLCPTVGMYSVTKVCSYGTACCISSCALFFNFLFHKTYFWSQYYIHVYTCRVHIYMYIACTVIVHSMCVCVLMCLCRWYRRQTLTWWLFIVRKLGAKTLRFKCPRSQSLWGNSCTSVLWGVIQNVTASFAFATFQLALSLEFRPL